MSSTMPRGGLRPCTRSIHWPDKSERAERFAGAASHCVSKRPIWLGEAAWSLDRLAADNPSHGWIAAQALGVVHVLISSEATKHRLSQHTDQRMAAVLARARVGECLACHSAQSERVAA